MEELKTKIIEKLKKAIGKDDNAETIDVLTRLLSVILSAEKRV